MTALLPRLPLLLLFVICSAADPRIKRDESRTGSSLPFSHKEMCASEANMRTAIDTTLAGWYDAKTVRAYREAISAFRKVFEECYAARLGGCWCDNGFEGWPHPYSRLYRTRKGIVLAGLSDKWGDLYRLDTLYTPLGQIKIFGSGLSDCMRSVSQCLAANMAQIGSMTKLNPLDVGHHFLKLYGEDEFIRCHWGPDDSVEESYKDVDLYLLCFSDELPFSSVVNAQPDDLDVFAEVSGVDHKKDARMFSLVTDDKMLF